MTRHSNSIVGYHPAANTTGDNNTALGSKKIKKPPIGLVPRQIIEEERYMEVSAAILRYLNHGLTIPIEWIAEYNELIDKIIKHKPLFKKGTA